MQADLMIYPGAMALGALHAFEPGHGKSIIAAYMIGTKGRAVDGIILGFIVTFTHTFSVIILGIIAKMLSQSFSDVQLHTWLGFFSSLLILGVGVWMLRERLAHHGGGHAHFHFFCKEKTEHDHSHGHAHHPHHDHGHTHDIGHNHSHTADHGHHNHESPVSSIGEDGRINRWHLLILGISGGIIPCPPAIAALLAAIGAGRTAEGLTVAIFFSVGLGLVMMTIGVILSQAGNLTKKVSDNLPLARKLGILSALIITVLGCVTLFHSIRGMFS